MATKDAAPEASQEDLLNRGGMWDKQRLMGGKRLRDEFEKDEYFILWALDVVGEVPVEDDRSATKVELTVSLIDSPEDKFTVGALGRAITEMAEAPMVDGDLPCVVYWDEVGTKRGLQPALVLTAVRRYTGE